MSLAIILQVAPDDPRPLPSVHEQPVYFVSTPGGQARVLVEALRQGGLNGTPPVDLLLCPATEVPAMMGGQPQARFVVIVEDPIRVATQVLADDPSGDAAAAVAAWREDARRLLEAVQLAPQRCLCLDVADTEVDAAPLWRSLADWLPRDQIPRSAVPRHDPRSHGGVASMLAAAVVQADPAVPRLFEELLACCAVLVREAPVATTFDLGAALADYRDLHARAHRPQSDAAHESVEVPEESPERAGLTGNQHACERTEARREANLLRLQLHQVQAELEHHALASRGLQPPSPTVAPGAPSGKDLSAATLRVVKRVDDGPHRHLDLRLERAQCGGRRWPALDLRLVDHLGRPGLVLFAEANGHKPLSAWQTTGQEAGREHMLIVPADAAGRGLLQPMGFSDWTLLTDAVDVITRHTAINPEMSSRWRGVALRLGRQLADLPSRLRYDELDVTTIDSHADLLKVRFCRVAFGSETFDEFTLHWQSAASGNARSPLRWQAPPEGTALPLVAWPVDESGMVAPEWPLPVGHATSVKSKLRAWGALSHTDRSLLLAVLDALPAAAERAPEGEPPGIDQRTGRRRAALALHKEARRLCASLQWREAARHVLRRAR